MCIVYIRLQRAAIISDDRFILRLNHFQLFHICMDFSLSDVHRYSLTHLIQASCKFHFATCLNNFKARLWVLNTTKCMVNETLPPMWTSARVTSDIDPQWLFVPQYKFPIACVTDCIIKRDFSCSVGYEIYHDMRFMIQYTVGTVWCRNTSCLCYRSQDNNDWLYQ